MDGDGGNGRDRIASTVDFWLGLVGTVFPVVALNRPDSLLGWVALLGGGIAVGLLAAGVSRDPRVQAKLDKLYRELAEKVRKVARRFGLGEDRRPDGLGWQPADPRRRARIRLRLTVLAVAVMVGVAAAPVGAALDIVKVRLFGCPYPVELRVLTSPGSLRSVQRVADAYERSTAAEHHGCPSANLFVYSAPALDVRDALREGWPDRDLVHWPRPDVWLADSGVEVDEVVTYQASKVVDGVAGSDESVIAATVADRRALGSTPLVLAVPADAAGTLEAALQGGQPTWSLLWDLVLEQGWDMVRPEPETLPMGRIATAALYDSVSGGGSDGELPLAVATEMERHLASSIHRGGHPAGDLDAMMCRFRFRSRVGSGPVTTVILTERSWIDYNQRELGVGARCEPGPGGTAGDGGGGQPDSAPPLIAFYPEDTLELDQVFVRLDWVDGGSPQGTAAAQFGEWLGGEPGRRMLREEPVGDDLIVGARAVGTPPDQDRVSSARLLQRQADPSGRLLVLVDTSGSMDQPTDADTGITRIEVAAEAVSATLDLMIPGDAFGLWTFPGPDQARVRERVPIEIAVDAPAIERHRQATDRALDEIRVGGATPLFAAIAEAVEVLRRSDDERITALVVVTDGADTGGGQTAAGLEDLVRADGGPRVFVIAVGEATCTNPLVQVTHAGGGQCHPGSFDDLDRTLRNVARTIWGGDGDDQ